MCWTKEYYTIRTAAIGKSKEYYTVRTAPIGKSKEYYTVRTAPIGKSKEYYTVRTAPIGKSNKQKQNHSVYLRPDYGYTRQKRFSSKGTLRI
jgi:hypothetical protein